MAEDSTNTTPENNSSTETSGTGTQNIMRRHLADPNDVITDEDIRNVEVGKSDEVSTTGAELQARFEDEISKEDEGKDDEDRDATPPNPWAVLK
ncbi:MAG TPA: hypothetical protein VEZ55_06040 [Chitinophagaceae bacterium]|jgi:hypothetical protein|nr:hypothetical protein [Chitinophagaceae bacterium]